MGTIVVELDKDAAVSLVKGTAPHYIIMGKLQGCGYFSATYSKWEWLERALYEKSTEELYEIYKMCRRS